MPIHTQAFCYFIEGSSCFVIFDNVSSCIVIISVTEIQRRIFTMMLLVSAQRLSGRAASDSTFPVGVCCDAAFARTALPLLALLPLAHAVKLSALALRRLLRATMLPGHTLHLSVGACSGPAYVLSASHCSRCEDTAGTSLQLLVRLCGRNHTILAVCTLHKFPRTPGARRETDTHLETWNFLFCFLPVPGSKSLHSVHSNNNQRSTETITDRQSPKHPPTHLLTFCVTF